MSSVKEETPSWAKKLIIGLTGNIATGKSTVMKIVAEKGALTLDADKIVHHILENDASMQAAIAVAFGSDVRRKDGSIDRAKLAAIVFSDPAALRDLELMLHPAVRVDLIERISRSDAGIVMIEAIKLLDGSLKEMCRTIWVTSCQPKRQIERLMICRGLDDESAVLRVNAQSSQEEKIAQADVVIDTGGTLGDTREQVDAAWEDLFAEPPNLPELEVAAEETEAEVEAPPTNLAESTAAEPAVAELVSEPPAAAEESDSAPANETGDVLVRRAKPSDLPAVLLLIRRATDNQVKMKRAELLMAMSERSYFIGQRGTEISAVMGYAVDSGLAHIQEMFIYPPENAGTIGAAVFAELEKSANQHFCEGLFAYPPQNSDEKLMIMLKDAGMEKRDFDDLPRVWKKATLEFQPPDTALLAKTLRDIRIA